jgi:hypothetical protein
MSNDFSIRPVGTPAPAPVAQPQSAAATTAVATELPASQAVTAAEAGGAARNNPQPSGDPVSHQAFIDLAAASIVYQVVDYRTNAVVQQYPDEATLRRRAYFHTLDMAKATPNPQLATDRKA